MKTLTIHPETKLARILAGTDGDFKSGRFTPGSADNIDAGLLVYTIKGGQWERRLSFPTCDTLEDVLDHLKHGAA